jgi:regulator of cell morphogenesis and NO signaling
MLDPQTTVAQTVLDHSACAAVFQRHRIDYCCHGDRSIVQACGDRGVDVVGLIAELEAAISERGDGGVEAAALDTSELIGHIVSTHHTYLRRALPFVGGLATKVHRVHGAKEPRLAEVETLCATLATELDAHLDDEEERLFPALGARPVDTRAVRAEFATMFEDHLRVGALLERLRAATDDFTPPAWACTSFRTLFAELANLEADILRHVHLENHVLMPRFVA